MNSTVTGIRTRMYHGAPYGTAATIPHTDASTNGRV